MLTVVRSLLVVSISLWRCAPTNTQWSDWIRLSNNLTLDIGFFNPCTTHYIKDKIYLNTKRIFLDLESGRSNFPDWNQTNFINHSSSTIRSRQYLIHFPKIHTLWHFCFLRSWDIWALSTRIKTVTKIILDIDKDERVKPIVYLLSDWNLLSSKYLDFGERKNGTKYY